MRSVGSHKMNERSSRSHCMVTLHVTSAAAGAGDDGDDATTGVTRYGKITFVDLAGSERLEQTESEGTMRAESGQINRSLFALGKVAVSECIIIDRCRVCGCSQRYHPLDV